jgi:hypothetical protein
MSLIISCPLCRADNQQMEGQRDRAASEAGSNKKGQFVEHSCIAFSDALRGRPVTLIDVGPDCRLNEI